MPWVEGYSEVLAVGQRHFSASLRIIPIFAYLKHHIEDTSLTINPGSTFPTILIGAWQVFVFPLSNPADQTGAMRYLRVDGP